MKPRFGRIAIGAAVLAVGLVVGQRAASAHLVTYNIVLNGLSESPANSSPGLGAGSVVVDLDLNTMHVHVDFAGLAGTTTASHIHSATAVPFAGTAGVATTTPTFAGFPLGVSSGSYDNTLDLTLASSYNPAYVNTFPAGVTQLGDAEAALLRSFDAGTAYLNIHSTFVPSGEIRGFLVAVPEPTGPMVLLPAVGLLGRRRR